MSTGDWTPNEFDMMKTEDKYYYKGEDGLFRVWNKKCGQWEYLDEALDELQASATIGAIGADYRPDGWSMMTRINYKYNEGMYMNEIRSYIDSTYDQHYSKNNFQATEFIIDGGHGTGFCIGNVLKYAQRYGRKGTPEDWRKDLMKVIHYAIIQLHVHDLENSKGEKK